MLSHQPDLHAGKDADISIAANLCAWDDRRVNIAQCKNAITGRADIATQAAQHGSAMTYYRLGAAVALYRLRRAGC
jgi:hypothetical protein